MSRPASRVLAMLELLQTHRRLTGADLGARLGIDERTVRRYAATLAELGIPVAAARGRRGGYRLAPRRRLPPLMLTDDEAVAVALAMAAADRMGLADEEVPALGEARQKLATVLPPLVAARVDAACELLGLPGPRGDATVAPAGAVLRALGDAVRHRRSVSVTHRDSRGRVTLRALDPYGVVFHAGRWQVVGRDHGPRSGPAVPRPAPEPDVAVSWDEVIFGPSAAPQEAVPQEVVPAPRQAVTEPAPAPRIRAFAVTSIVAVEETGGEFAPPPGFDPVRHVTRELGGSAYRWEVEVVIGIDLTRARELIPATAAELTEVADGVLLRARAKDLAPIARLLAGLEWPFAVIRPDELRHEVGEHAARLIRLAARTRLSADD